MLNIWELFFLFFAFQALLVAVFFFFRKKGNTFSNRILSLFLVLFACNLTYNVLYWSKLLFRIEYIHFYGLLAIIWTLYPPLMYIYVRKVIKNKNVQLKDLIHLLPTLSAIWLYIPLYSLSSYEKLEALRNQSIGQHIRYIEYITPFFACIMFFYTVYTYFSFKDTHVGYNKKRWFYWVLGSFSCYVFSMITYFTLSYIGIIDTEHDYIIMYVITFFIGLISYFGYKQPQIFEGLSMDKILPFKKYQKTGLTKSYALELKETLTVYFDENKPYLNSELRLDDLAEKLNLSRHHTSQIINEHFDANFFDFINSYRIEEAKKSLTSKNDLSITDIIFSSGFNNRVSFYKAFKKHTGTTPSSYKTHK
ncbi:helix-turn-helix domain-containing protein [Dokdonia sp.]|uniref:AraC family transcriptional regulator n=1 Tax=Dokdonia sp. TaxID=2024995 RepID=UPI00326345E4